MIKPEEAREQALSFLSQQGLEYEFVENASLKIDDAKELIQIIKEQNPQKILEIGTFVGVSSAVLGLCVPQAQIVCIDADLPVEAQNALCLRKFNIHNKSTNLDFVAKLINYLGIAERFTLHRGYFSCCFPHEEDRQKLINNGIDIKASEIIGQRICEEYGPFEVVFLDADHRTAAVKSDLELLFPYVVPGGIIILHDVGSDYWGEQVRSAVQDFLEQYPESKFHLRGEIGFIHKFS